MNSSSVFHLCVWTGNSAFITLKSIFFSFCNFQIKFIKLEKNTQNFDSKLGTNDPEGYVVVFLFL